VSKTSRIYGLDAARAFLLLGGPLVHSVFITSATPSLDLVVEGSHLFRMAAFFCIAGFLFGMNPSVAHTGWLRPRLRQLLVPLVSVCCILYLLQIWVRYTYPDLKLIGPMVPLHLWFLISLALISPVVLMMDRSGWGNTLAQWFDTHKRTLVPSIITLSIAMVLADQALFRYYRVNHVVISDLWSIIVTQTPRFAVFYLLGFFLARSPRTVACWNTPWIIALGPIGVIGTLIFYNHFGGEGLLSGSLSAIKMTLYVMTEITQVLMCLTIIFLALRVKTVHSSIMAFSRASYTVYLFHYVFIITVGYALVYHYPAMNQYVLYTLLVVSSLILSYGVHFVIKQSRLLLFIFNGKGFS
jgi:glucan biosynthesis protein C